MKLFTSFAVASIFTGSLIVACGGSSQNPGSGTNPDAGGSTTPDSGSVIADSGANTGDSAGPACTKTSDCTTAGDTCCLASVNGGQCIPSTATCAGATVGCTTTGDCTGGDVCCGTITGTSGASACQTAPCASGAYELCTPGSTQCPAGDTCFQPTMLLPIGYCQAVKDGGGNTSDGGDSGSNDLDSGSGDATGE